MRSLKGMLCFGVLFCGLLALRAVHYFSGRGVRQVAPAVQLTRQYFDLLAFWEHERERDPFSFIAMQHIAQLHLSIARSTGDESHYRQAEEVLRQALPITPKNDPLTEALLARAMMSRHAFREARDIAERLLAANPGSEMLIELRADAALGMGDYVSAFADIDTLSQSHPGYSASVHRAQKLELEGKLDEALTAYRKAERAYDDHGAEPVAWLLVQLGQNRLTAGDSSAAEAAFREALERVPDYGRVYSPLARVFELRGDDEQAKAYLLKAVESAPEPGVFHRLAAIERRAGNEASAVMLEADALRRAEQRANDGTGGHLRELAELLLDRGEQLPLALELATRDLEMRGGDVRSQYVAARASRLNGDPVAAARHIRQAQRLGTRDRDFNAEAEAITRAMP